jgi:hypothetical protein
VKHSATRLGLVIFSAGWLVPFTYSLASAYDFLFRWVWPAAAYNDHSSMRPLHPFYMADKLFYVSVAWLAAAIVFWVLRATRNPKL